MTYLSANEFFQASEHLFAQLFKEEWLTLQLSGENTQFLRFNAGKARQLGDVSDYSVTLKFQKNNRTLQYSTSFLRNRSENLEHLTYVLEEARRLAKLLPEDPFFSLPTNHTPSHAEFEGNIPSIIEAPQKVLDPFKAHDNPIKNHDFSGIYVGGWQFRGVTHSLGLKHWYASRSCYVDYSLSHPSGRAVKGIYATSNWNEDSFHQEIQDALNKAKVFNRPIKKIAPGPYRTYLAPDAASELVGMFSWHGLSESALRQGESSLDLLRSGQKPLSPLFHLVEDFSNGTTPRFNEDGELAPEVLVLIEAGRLKHTLISSRTAQEYGLVSNGASGSEGLRAPRMRGGTLKEDQVLKRLGTGLYLSNLHYLNWSDVKGARVTGMTRYSPLWVEDGEIVAPISDMRFDESLYDCLGGALEALTQEERPFPSTHTYGQRDTGGVICPGLLLQKFNLTL